jgi:hypothetical protein
MELNLGCSIATVVAVALLVSASSFVIAIGGGDSLVATDDPLNATYRYQPLPGELDLDALDMTLVWKAKGRNVTTPILVEDLDRDGLKEIVFGMDNGRVIARELANNETVLDIQLTDEAIVALVVGNVDEDKDDEIVFTSAEGIYCYDFAKEKLRWNESLEILDAELHLVGAEVLKDDLTKHDIVILWSDSTHYLGPQHHLARYTGNGEMLWRSDLSPLLYNNGPYASCLVLDLDGDGTLEVFVNDFGYWDYGWGGYGRNIWILNVTSGRATKTMSVGQVHLMSAPIPVVVDGSTSVAIGLRQNGSGNSPDLLIYDGNARRHRLMDISNSTKYNEWSFLAFAPDETGGTVVISNGWHIHSFSWKDPSVNGTHPSSASGHDSPHILCDIDNDGVMDILAPGGGVHIIDSESMQKKAQITIHRPGGGVPSRATKIRFTVADLDDDRRSEVVFGYYDDGDAETFFIFYLGAFDTQVDDPTPTGVTVGWGIIAFVVGANILLVALLLRDYRRRGKEED